MQKSLSKTYLAADRLDDINSMTEMQRLAEKRKKNKTRPPLLPYSSLFHSRHLEWGVVLNIKVPVLETISKI
jgi:hypothetical protein